MRKRKIDEVDAASESNSDGEGAVPDNDNESYKRLNEAQRAAYLDEMVASTVAAMEKKSNKAAVTELAMLMSTDVEFQKTVAQYWNSKLTLSTDGTLQESLTIMNKELYAHPIQLEATTRGSVRTDATLYLFGIDRPFFSIPIDRMWCNPKIMAYVIRLILQGHQLPGAQMFTYMTCSNDNCENTFKRFQFNNTFSRDFSRGSFFVSQVACFASCSMLTAAHDKEYNYFLAMRALALSATSELLTFLVRREVQQARTWLSTREVDVVRRVRATCVDDALFSAYELMGVLAQNITSITRQRHELKTLNPATVK